MNKNLVVAHQFFKRDIRVYKGRIANFLVDYTVITPLMFALSFGYVLPLVGGFGEGKESLVVFLGTVLWGMFPVAFHLSYGVFSDLRGNRFVAYQALMASPKILVLEKLFFYSIICFLAAIPLLPLCLTFLGYFNLLFDINWIRLVVILYLGSFLVSAYYLLFMIVLPGPEKMDVFWRCITYPLAIMGGETIPRYAISKFSPVLGRLILLDPFIYISEGIRGEVIGGSQYLSFTKCCLGLVVSSVLFVFITFYRFKKRIDHV